MTNDTLKIVLAVMMTAVLASTGTYIALNPERHDIAHQIVDSGHPQLDLGSYIATDIYDSSSPAQNSELEGFDSFRELKTFLDRHVIPQNYNYYNHNEDGLSLASEQSAMEGMGSSDRYSTDTNIQVAGVDEGDIVKNDGEFAYIISDTGDSVFILQAYPAENVNILSQIESSGRFVDMYVQDDRLIMLEQVYYFEGGFRSSNYLYSDAPLVNVKIFDISNRSSPMLVNAAAVGGNYLTSRLIDGTLYAVGNQYIQDWDNESQLPVPLESVYHIETDEESYILTCFLTMDTEDDESLPAVMGIMMASSNSIYVSEKNMYITHTDYSERVGLFSDIQESSETTVIHRIGIQGQDLKYKARGEVAGRILNRFSMDEFNGHFRVATTKDRSWGAGAQQSRNIVSVLDMALNPTGILDNIAPGEQVYSARFMGPRLYLVTFRQVDPFFVIDMHDAENPKILGELKIPGYSSYLHPYDENHIIGLGMDGSKVKLALFNVTDVENPTELDSVAIGSGYTYSEALTDPHAFMFDRLHSLLVIPVNGYDYERGNSANAAYVFEISPENGIVQKGYIEHEAGNLPEYDYYGYNSYNQVRRSFVIGDSLYTVSSTMMKVNEIDGLDEIAEVRFG